MVSFINGPAAGQILAIRRAPLLLRVVHNGTDWDALDHPADTPSPNETIHVYERVGEASSAHVCSRSRGRSLSGWYAVATYRHFPEQPPDADVRTLAAWDRWNAAALGRRQAAETT